MQGVVLLSTMVSSAGKAITSLVKSTGGIKLGLKATRVVIFNPTTGALTIKVLDALKWVKALPPQTKMLAGKLTAAAGALAGGGLYLWGRLTKGVVKPPI